MSWMIACFCGRMFSGPPLVCPHCGSHVPDPARQAVFHTEFAGSSLTTAP
jgi:rRNA maturation endonuclease Nob1